MRTLLILFLALFCFACTSDPAQGWKELDLMQYNVPVSILAPDSVKVQTSNLSGIMQDVTLQSLEDNYSIQILGSQANTNDMTRLKAEQLELVRENRYFESIVREEPQGFIFLNRIDSTELYGFRHIVYLGDKEFVFQNAFDGTFNLEQIEAMYTAVKAGK